METFTCSRKAVTIKYRIYAALFFLTVLTALFLGSPEASSAKTTDSATPTKISSVNVKWEKILGGGWQESPTPPLCMDGYVYTYAKNTVYQIRAFDGKTTKTWSINGTPEFATIPLTASDDQKSIFGFANAKDKTRTSAAVPGRVFRIDISEDKVKYASTVNAKGQSVPMNYKGQNINPLIYKNGRLYGATWEGTNNSGKTTDPGTVFCVDASTMKVLWKFQDKGNGGFYWDGAYITDNGKYTVIGSEAGNVYVLNSNGKEVHKDKRFTADSSIHSTIVSDNQGYLYFVSSNNTKSTGYLYKLKLSADGILSKTAKPASLGAPSSNTPIINGTQIYVGYGHLRGNKFGVRSYDITENELKQVSNVSAPGAIQGEMLYSNASGYLYAAINKEPGQILCFKVNTDGKLETGKTLFTPTHKAYSLSPIDCDENGDLYYKNDSGYIMAVTEGHESAPILSSVTASGYKSIRISWKSRENAKKYQIRRNDGKIFNCPPDKKSYPDTSVTTGKSYSYSIRAVLPENKYTLYSRAKSAKTIPAKTTVTAKSGKKKASVQWKKSGGAKSYQIFRSTRKSGGFKKVKTATGSLKWTDTKLKSKTTYYYKVRACTAVSGKTVCSTWSNICKVKTK